MKFMRYISLLGLHANTHTMEPKPKKNPTATLTLTLSLPAPERPRFFPHRGRSASTSRYYDRIESTILDFNTSQSSKKIRKKQTIAQISNPNTHGNSYFINAAIENNIPKIEQMLTSKDLKVNHKNEWGNTALHCAAMRKHKKIITLLLNDFRTDASIANSEGLRARDCFIAEQDNEEDRLIRIALFFRAMLNIAVHEESFATLMSNSLNKKDIENTILNVKKRITDNYKHQELYQELPTDRYQDDEKNDNNNDKKNYFPNYITDDFIENMILIKLDEKI